METLTTFLFLSIAILAGFATGILGFIFVIILGILVQISMQRRKDERRLYETIERLKANQKIAS
jgi:hypothetical protein